MIFDTTALRDNVQFAEAFNALIDHAHGWQDEGLTERLLRLIALQLVSSVVVQQGVTDWNWTIGASRLMKQHHYVWPLAVGCPDDGDPMLYWFEHKTLVPLTGVWVAVPFRHVRSVYEKTPEEHFSHRLDDRLRDEAKHPDEAIAYQALAGER